MIVMSVKDNIKVFFRLRSSKSILLFSGFLNCWDMSSNSATNASQVQTEVLCIGCSVFLLDSLQLYIDCDSFCII